MLGENGALARAKQLGAERYAVEVYLTPDHLMGHAHYWVDRQHPEVLAELKQLQQQAQTASFGIHQASLVEKVTRCRVQSRIEALLTSYAPGE